MSPSTINSLSARINATKHLRIGYPEYFLEIGRYQLQVLLSLGLHPQSRVLDVGSGLFRAGYWLVRLLDEGNYYAIEPNETASTEGYQHFIQPTNKQIHLHHNPNFNINIFKTHFDFVLAYSIWTHTSKQQTNRLIAQFSRGNHTLLAATYNPAMIEEEDYRDKDWSVKAIRHLPQWFQRLIDKLNLIAITPPIPPPPLPLKAMARYSQWLILCNESYEPPPLSSQRISW
jgi:SAM-dependent methyltransferase